MGFRWAGWLGLLMAAVGLASAGAPADATFPGANGKIAFVRYTEGGSHIFVMNADGSGVTQLTESPGYDGSPAWSPDGTRIAFARVPVDGDFTGPGKIIGPGDIYVMNADGSGLVNLTDSPASEGGPAWSPDGTQIAFSWNRNPDDADVDIEIFIMRSDGSGVRQLTDDPNPSLGGQYLSTSPNWSPDGRRIVFLRGTMTQPGDICLVGADGNGELNVSADPEFESSPDWSPDGSQIVFANRDGLLLYSMNPDGTSGIRRLLSETAAEPAWSPDGSKIAFVGGRPAFTNLSIWVMNPDGTAPTRLSDGSESDDEPAWQPLPGARTGTSSTLVGSRVSAAVPSTAGCVPVWPPLVTPGPERLRQITLGEPVIPVGGGPGFGDSVGPSHRDAVLVLVGLILIAGSFVAVLAARRM